MEKEKIKNRPESFDEKKVGNSSTDYQDLE